MTQDTTAPGRPEPGPDTFDFAAWLDDNASFPSFSHTAYVDQENGARLGRVRGEIDEIAERLVQVNSDIENRRKVHIGSLVDPKLDLLLAEQEELEQYLGTLRAEEDRLKQEVYRRRLVLHFEVKTPEELGRVTRKAGREYDEAHPGEGGDEDGLSDRAKHILSAQIAHFCTGREVVHPKTGEMVKLPPLTHAEAQDLMGRLIQSEMMRLMEAIGTELSASREWADSIDAGFPGGSADVAGVGVDSDGAEGGEGVGRSSADDAAGSGIDLVR